jgi:hypothetical protein
MDYYVKGEGKKAHRISDYSCVGAFFGDFESSQTTADMTFISWNKPFSMFPYATFVDGVDHVVLSR